MILDTKIILVLTNILKNNIKFTFKLVKKGKI